MRGLAGLVGLVAVGLAACGGGPEARSYWAQPSNAGVEARVWGDVVEGESDSESESETDSVTEADFETDFETESDADSVTASESDSEPETTSDADVEAETFVETASEADVEADTETTEPPEGTLVDPFVVTTWPFVVDDTTLDAPSDELDNYSCAPATNESGPERIYVFDVADAGTFVAEVSDDGAVDVDVQLLDTAPQAGVSPVPCVARHDRRIQEDLAPGRYWLVVDTYVAAAGPKPGPYRLALEWTVPDAWQVVTVAPGIVWKKKFYSNYAGGEQTIHALDVDLSDPAIEIRPAWTGGCRRPSTAAIEADAIAAVNAGFFDTSNCASLDLVKIAGVVKSQNHLTGNPQRSLGFTEEGTPMMEWVDANSDWPAAWNASGSYPSLVTDGVVQLEPDRDSDFFDARHPRTAAGLTAAGHLVLVTVDGRSETGSGMTLAALAQHMVNLGCVQAVNFDGGGSTTMWIRGQSTTGVVNSPSDDAALDHAGERAVSDALLVIVHD